MRQKSRKVYTYVCKVCGEEVERESTAPKPRCPVCRGKTHKKYFPINFILKGSGFYLNDKEKK